MFLSWGFFKKVKVYEVFVEGAKHGFDAVGIRPYLVAMLVGDCDLPGATSLKCSHLLTSLLAVTGELPMAIMRPLSGSGSLGIMTELMKTHRPIRSSG